MDELKDQSEETTASVAEAAAVVRLAEMLGTSVTRAMELDRDQMVELVVEWAGEVLVVVGAADVGGSVGAARRFRLRAAELLEHFDVWLALRKGLDSTGWGPRKRGELVVSVLRSAGVRWTGSGRYFAGLRWREGRGLMEMQSLAAMHSGATGERVSEAEWEQMQGQIGEAGEGAED